MKNQLFGLFCFFGTFIYTSPVLAYQDTSEAQTAFQYLCHEVEEDATLTHEKRHEKIQKFKNFADNLSPEVASRLISLLLQETHARISDILQNAGLSRQEIDAYLIDYEKAIIKVKNMTVEIARQMLFFVAELKIHRQYVYDYGIALGCPEKQLLRHDLCKLSADQFEGYARYFRGGRRDEDKLAYLSAWKFHQCEEHHLESYDKKRVEGFSEERIQNNMLEAVADWLAASKQRGGGTVIDYLVHVFPKTNPHPSLLPFLKKALIKAHALYLNSEEDPAYSIFKASPCWNSDVERVFCTLEKGN